MFNSILSEGYERARSVCRNVNRHGERSALLLLDLPNQLLGLACAGYVYDSDRCGAEAIDGLAGLHGRHSERVLVGGVLVSICDASVIDQADIRGPAFRSEGDEVVALSEQPGRQSESVDRMLSGVENHSSEIHSVERDSDLM